MTDHNRPILRGRDIKRFGYDWAGLWLINTHNGVKGKYPPIDINDYPAVKQHLDFYWDKLKNRDDKGITPYNLRNCAYLDDFNKPKIVYREIGIEMDACLVPEKWVINNKLYMITGENLIHLIAFLNSRIFNKIILASANITGGKGVDFLSNIKVPTFEQCDLSTLTDDIDSTLYRFYNFSKDEIIFIENR